MSSNGTCELELLGKQTSGIVIWSYFHAIASSVLLGGSLFGFLRLRNLPYLKHRNFLHFCVLGVGWLSHLFASSILRIALAGGNPNFLNTCGFTNFVSAFCTPAIISVELVRTILFHNRAKLNAALAEAFDNRGQKKNQTIRKKSSMIMSSTVSSAQSSFSVESFTLSDSVKALRLKAQAKYGNQLLLLILLGIIGLCVVLTLINCSDLLGDDDCKDFALTNDETIIFSITPAFLLLVLCGWVQYKDKNTPDPFGILVEIKYALLYSFAILIPSLVLIFLDVGKFEDKDEVGFTYGLLIDATFATFFIYSLPLQVYKAWKFSKSKKQYDSMSLETLLQNPVGKKLFRNHLAHEFSVQNLNFYDAVLYYETQVASPKIDSSVANNIAKNIFETYILDKSGGGMNLPGDKINNLKEIFEGFKNGKRILGPAVLEEAKIEIFELMENDAFPRFKCTREFRDFLGVNEQPGRSIIEL